MATTDEFFEDARKTKLLHWLLLPKAERQPSSQVKFAEEVGVSPRTIRDWMAHPTFRAVWEKEAKAVFDPSMVQAVIDRMYAHALDDTSPKQAKAWELFLKTVDALRPPQMDMAAKKAAEMTDAELEAMIAQAAQSERAQREADRA